MKQKERPSSCDQKGGADEADDRVAKLTGILKRLNEGADPLETRREAREFLASVSPADLCRAEQQLMTAGMGPEELRHLCAIHLEMVDQQTGRMLAELDPGHVIHTMVGEHETMLGFLDDLAGLNRAIQHMDSHDDGAADLGRLRHLARQFLETEPHHRREEEVLFPELERRGIFAPCQIIRTEHEELRARKQELMHLAEGVGQMDFSEFKTRLDVAANMLVLTLRDHIINENGILYPTALELIQDERVWDRMKAECYSIGDCCFATET